jgi:hypothetical protein
VVLDTFMLQTAAQKGMINLGELLERIRNDAFPVIILSARVDREGEPIPPFFGVEVIRAVRERYEFAEDLGRYFVYVPRGRAGVGGEKR